MQWIYGKRGEMIKRILRYDTDDWKHNAFLIGVILKGFWQGDLSAMVDGWWFLKIHLLYDSYRVK